MKWVGCGVNYFNINPKPNIIERIIKMYSELVIIKSCFSSTEHDIKENLDLILSEHNKYKRKKMPLLNDDSIPRLEYLQTSFENSGQFPSERLFLLKFPRLLKSLFLNTVTISVDDFRVYVANFIKERLSQQIALKIEQLTPFIRDVGISEEVNDKWEELKYMSGSNKTPDIQIRQDSRTNYNERLYNTFINEKGH